jgi:hypothetical protein
MSIDMGRAYILMGKWLAMGMARQTKIGMGMGLR